MHSIIQPNYELCIVGAGGFGKETLCNYIDIIKPTGRDYKDLVIFAEQDEYWTERQVMGLPVKKLSEIDVVNHKLVIAIGDGATRKRIAEQLPENTAYATLIHPSVISSQHITIGAGSIICAGVVMTCDIHLGKHAIVNLNTTVGHDVTAEDYFTTAPGVAISGNCTFGHRVSIGSNAAIKEKITVADEVTIGMGTVVIRDIAEAGVYVGNPARKLSWSVRPL